MRNKIIHLQFGTGAHPATLTVSATDKLSSPDEVVRKIAEVTGDWLKSEDSTAKKCARFTGGKVCLMDLDAYDLFEDQGFLGRLKTVGLASVHLGFVPGKKVDAVYPRDLLLAA
jgi:hypothetical protein